MAEKPHSRRRFLRYVGAGTLAAAIGLGYLTRDYWYSVLQEHYKTLFGRVFPESSSTFTPTPASSETISPSSVEPQTPTVTPEATSTSTPTEEEEKIREMLTNYANAWIRGDIGNIISFYTDDAVLNIWWLNTGSQTHKGKKAIFYYYGGMSSGSKLTWIPSTFQIENIEISERKDKATVSSHCLWMTIYANLRANSTYQLVDLSTIKSYLKKGSWKIRSEKTDVYRSG